MKRRNALLAISGFAVTALSLWSITRSRPSQDNASVICCDCSSKTPIIIDGMAMQNLRKQWSGIGFISPSSKLIPYAIITIDGTDLSWTGQHLERHDYPLPGYCTSWRFPAGKRVTDRGIPKDSQQRLSALIEELKRP